MKTVHSIFNNSAIASLTYPYRYAVLLIFLAIVLTALSLLTFTVTHASDVSWHFNF